MTVRTIGHSDLRNDFRTNGPLDYRPVGLFTIRTSARFSDQWTFGPTTIQNIEPSPLCTLLALSKLICRSPGYSNAELWCFLCCWLEHIVYQIVEIPLICDVLVLMWYHRNGWRHGCKRAVDPFPINGASPYHQMTLIYFRSIILDCLWNVLEVFFIKYGINFLWYHTLYLISNVYVQSSLMEYALTFTFMYRYIHFVSLAWYFKNLYKLKNFVCNIWWFCQSEFLSEYLIMYILYSCVYIACPLYVLYFIACHLFLLYCRTIAPWS